MPGIYEDASWMWVCAESRVDTPVLMRPIVLAKRGRSKDI